LIGKTLGQYEVIELLGSGGMGDVYRALDTTLKREVALKVLPAALAADEQRLARLEREAQLLAAVNHPNIAAIYNLEQSGEIRWLVLELVEGKTLEQLLGDGPFSIAESVRIGSQVASALEAAHEKGIVHRDLKTANVMLDAKGRVKVLDFGIAKDVSQGATTPRAAVPPQDPAEVATQAAVSMAAQLTATGMIVGTAPYMSPEQIRGRELDKRSDNWAFGCLMFELLTGKRPFGRETMADTLSAILEHEPDWRLLPPDTPPAVEKLIRRCLQKDADTRLHDVADARIELDEATLTITGASLPAQAGVASGTWASSERLRVAATFAMLLTTVSVVGNGGVGAGRSRVRRQRTRPGNGRGAAVREFERRCDRRLLRHLRRRTIFQRVGQDRRVERAGTELVGVLLGRSG